MYLNSINWVASLSFLPRLTVTLDVFKLRNMDLIVFL